jgi:hypothetical protein
MGEKVNTKRAAEILTELNRPTERATLDTQRSTGGGPPFYKVTGKKRIVYDTDELAEYAKADQLVRYTSTSEYSTRKRKPPKPNGNAHPEPLPDQEGE